MRVMRAGASAAFVACVLVAGCGSGKSEPASEASGQSGPSSADTTTVPKNPLPPKLQGTWLQRSSVLGPLRLYLRETTYTASHGDAHSGHVEAEGDVLTFRSMCGGTNVEGTGRYRWKVSGGSLHLALIGKDECTGRSSGFAGTTFERSG
jgi:hypothetical protein